MNRRILFIAFSIVYFLLFKHTYQYIISPTWSYFGLTFNDQNKTFPLLNFVLAIGPSFVIPVRYFRPSFIFLILHYTLLYIPIYVLVGNIEVEGYTSFDYIFLLFFVFLSMLILTSFTFFPTLKIKRIYLRFDNNLIYLLVFLSISICSFLLIYFSSYVYENISISYSITNFIFESNSSNRELLYKFSHTYTGGFLSYLLMWMNGVALPLLFSYSLLRKNILLSIICMFCYLSLFLVAGYKSSFFALFFIPVLSFLILRSKNIIISILFAFITVFLLLTIISFTANYYGYGHLASIPNWIFLRVYANCALVFIQFYEFFLYNDFTFFSHVKIINKLINYPYNHDLGKVVANYHYGGGINTNGGFWSTDGIASAGITGLLLISLFCSFVFYIFDSITREFDVRYITISLAFISLNILNISIFTTLLSGGFIFLFIFFYSIRKKVFLKNLS